MKQPKQKNGLSREEASKLYEQLRAGFNKKMTAMGTPGVTPKAAHAQLKRRAAPAAAAGLSTEDLVQVIQRATGDANTSAGSAGKALAIILVLVFGGLKVTFSALEHAGIASVSPAEASIAMNSAAPAFKLASGNTQVSREEINILSALDARRQELESRARKLDERDLEQEKRDREFAAKLTELRELTDRLKGERDKDDKKRENQLAQLANVYGSMNPQEAAQLMEQLDVTIALSLIERMPEKRIGQILALMSPERALSITRMLSGKASK